MRFPPRRLTIGRLMALILLVAGNLLVVRGLTPPALPYFLPGRLLLAGGLPMANLVVVGFAALLVLRADDPRRPALAGTVAAGTATLVGFVALVCAFPYPFERVVGAVASRVGLPPELVLGIITVGLVLVRPLVTVPLAGWAARSQASRRRSRCDD